ncbi:unnamed protein product [Vitrella brassicaformis CCMP3155]|uniref:F-box domain-containing protein n=1 Tax=Vitrella brassicaformis (strain CCMP3155) TaxID=1169540 RepID=A0A0G4GL52_VITBC|nr:unnamed protein product [Vitrella brassicaformis CCMP3155]|eukprot:CEM30753.1 unnamed protein product [Vitrella brassicaformis CCMP3155]
MEVCGGADENAGKRPRVDLDDSSPAAGSGGGGCSTGVAVDGGQPSDQEVHPVIDWADKANVCRLVPLLKKIKSLEAQTATVLSEMRPYVTPTLADKVPALSNKLLTVEQSVASRHDALRGLIKTLDSVKVAKPPLPQPIANRPLPPDTIITQLGRPCLDGLPPDVAHIVLAFLPTKDAAPLSRVNQAMKQLVTDDTRGVYRHLVIGVDERQWWDAGIRRNARRTFEDIGVHGDGSSRGSSGGEGKGVAAARPSGGIRRTAWQTGESLSVDGDGSSEEEDDDDDDEAEEEDDDDDQGEEDEEREGGEGDDEEGGGDDSAGEGAAGGADLRQQSKRLREQDTLKTLKQKLGRLRTVHISSHWKGLDFPLECIEASRDTVRSMKLDYTPGFENYHYSVSTSPPTVTFSQLEELYVEDWPDHRGFRGWRFPSLLRLRAGNRSYGGHGVSDIVEHAPKLKSLSIEELFADDEDDDDFASLIQGCPHLTDIEWVKMDGLYDFTSTLGKLKRALDPIWTKDSLKDVEKRIGLEFGDKISVPFTHELLHPTDPDAISLPAFLDWAALANCTVDWRVDEVAIDCSRDLVTSPPAPTGPIAKMIKDISSTAKEVTLRCGGRPLDQSWAGLLVFTKANKVSVEGLTSSRALSSVPQWMAARSDTTSGNRHLPNITSLVLDLGVCDGVPAGLDGPGTLLGTLDRLTTVSLTRLPSLGVAAFCLSQLPPDVKLESVEVRASVCGSEVPAISDCARYPHIASMTVEVIVSETIDEVASGVALIAAVRPAAARLVAFVDLSALHNLEKGDGREAAFHSVVEQCIHQAEKAHYGLIADDSESGGGFDVEWSDVELQLVRLPTHS